MVYRSFTKGIPKQESPTRTMVDRELHGRFVQAADMAFRRTPDHGWEDMRRKRQRFWGNLLRRIDQLIDAGIPMRVILTIPAVLAAYIRERCIERDADAALRLTRRRTA